MQYAYKNGKILNGTKEMHVHLAGNGKPQKKQRDNAKLVKTLMSNGISRAIAYRMVAGFAKDELLSGDQNYHYENIAFVYRRRR